MPVLHICPLCHHAGPSLPASANTKCEAIGAFWTSACANAQRAVGEASRRADRMTELCADMLRLSAPRQSDAKGRRRVTEETARLVRLLGVGDDVLHQTPAAPVADLTATAEGHIRSISELKANLDSWFAGMIRSVQNSAARVQQSSEAVESLRAASMERLAVAHESLRSVTIPRTEAICESVRSERARLEATIVRMHLSENEMESLDLEYDSLVEARVREQADANNLASLAAECARVRASVLLLHERIVARLGDTPPTTADSMRRQASWHDTDPIQAGTLADDTDAGSASGPPPLQRHRGEASNPGPTPSPPVVGHDSPGPSQSAASLSLPLSLLPSGLELSPVGSAESLLLVRA